MCPICLDESGYMITLKCNHKIHKVCLMDYIDTLQTNRFMCPMCRKKMKIVSPFFDRLSFFTFLILVSLLQILIRFS